MTQLFLKIKDITIWRRSGERIRFGFKLSEVYLASAMGSSSLHDPLYIHIREALRDMREKAGLTHRALAELLEKPYSYVYKSEAGERKIDPIEWARWCTACENDPAKSYRQLLKKFDPVL